MKKNELLGIIMLLIAAVIWGTTFVAQSEAMDDMGPFTYSTARCILGAVVLVPVILVSDAAKKKIGIYKSPSAEYKKKTLIAGCVCGIVLFIAAAFQQVGMAMGTGSGKAGFITAMYMLIVPIIGLFMKKKVRAIIWPCLLVATVGLYLLCITGDFSFRTSDIVVFGGAISFAVHIMVIEVYSPYVDGIRLSCLQLVINAILSAVFMVIFEEPTWAQLQNGWFAIVYAGVLSSGVAYTLQILAQQRTNPTIASMLMSLESVFAVLGGAVILGEIPTAREAIGCIMMFAAIIVAQLPTKAKKSRV